jgi:hypothetical protein
MMDVNGIFKPPVQAGPIRGVGLFVALTSGLERTLDQIWIQEGLE